MKTKLLLLITIILMGFSFETKAQTLVAGDIVVIGMGSNTGPAAPGTLDEFSWVPLVNLNANTIIYFTDAGWNTASSEFMGSGNSFEMLLKYTVPTGGVLAGVVKTVSEGSDLPALGYTVIQSTKCGNDTALTIANVGDQVTVFTSTATPDANFPAAGTFTPIFSLTNETTNWAALTATTATVTPASSKQNFTNLVPNLENGTNALAIGLGPAVRQESDDVRYVGITTGSKAVILAAVTTASNWRKYDGSPTISVGADFLANNGTSPVLGWTANGVSNFSVSGADITVPSVSSIALVGSPAANSSSVTFTVTFSEAVTNVSTDDFTVATVSGSATGSVTGASGSGTTYTITVSSIAGTGSLKLNLKSNTNIIDTSNNGNGTNGFVAAYTSGGTQNVDRDNPTVTMTSPQSDPTNATGITVNITFSESVTGFTNSDIVVVNGTAGSFSGSGASYSALITPSGDGTVTVSIGASVAIDTANNNNNAATSLTRVSDRTQPTITMTSTASNPTNVSSFTLNINFSESVNNFVVGDLTISNAALSGFSGSGNAYSVTVTPTSDGTVTADIAAGVANDTAGNNNTIASQFSRVLDRSQPNVSISSATANPTNSNSIPVTITFNESVINFIASDITVANGSISGFTGSGANYSFNLIPSSNGTVTVNIAGNVANDSAGNANSAATQFSRVYDSVNPTVTMSSTTTSPTNSTSIPVTVTFSETVTGFTSGDISVGNAILSGFSGSGSSYSFNLTPSGSGTITANIVAGIATDNAGNGNTSATQFSIIYDNSQPSISITSVTPSPTNLNSIPVTFTFSKSVTGFIASDITVGNGSLSGFSGSGSSYSANITPTSSGTITVNVSASVAIDTAGNNNTVATQFSIVYDNSQPTVSITSTTSNPTNTSPIPVTITFSEAVNNFVVGDITIGNGSASGFSGSGSSYSFNLTPTSNGTVTVNIAGNIANDTAGNGNTAATQFSNVYDSVGPTVSMSSTTTSPTNSTSIPVTVTFSETVTGFTSGDISVGNATLSGFSGSGSSYSFNLIPSGSGTVTANIVGGIATDNAGNPNTAASQFSIIYDNSQPSIAINSTAGNLTNIGTIPVTFTFSESVNDFTSSDIVIGNGTLSGFSGSGNSFSANITPASSGTVTVNIVANSATDTAGNGNTAATQFSIVYDNTSPSVSISSSSTSPTNASSIVVTFTFNETVLDFTSGDIIVSNGTLSGFSGSGNSYSVNITPTVDGTVTVNIAANSATDPAGNENTAATQFSIISDKSGPTLNITSTSPNPTNGTTIPVSFTFSESVTGFTSNDITITNGTVSNFSGSGSVYSATVTPSADGTISLFVFQGNANDSAGNGNAFASFSIVSDRTKPTVTISSSEVSPTSANPIPINFNFSEAVNNFVVGDITVTGATLSGFSGSGSSYSVNLIPSSNGSKTVKLLAGLLNDSAGNTNNLSSTFAISYLAACSLASTWNGFFWVNGDPTPNQPAIITADYSTNGVDLSACSLIIGNNAQVIVNSGDDVTISNNVTVQAGSTLTFESGSNLIQSGTTNNNSGSITYLRPTTMRRLDYTYWSSPVAEQNLKLFSPQTVSPPIGASRFYVLNETTNAFDAVDPLITSFSAAKGYSIRAPNNFPDTPTTFEGVFTGVPNSGTYTIPVTVTSAGTNGYNLIGNPYPSTIDANQFLTTNPGTLYFWTHNVLGATSGANYASYNLTGGTASILGGDAPNGTIQTGQGFLIQKSTAGTVTFTNTMRLGNNDNQFYKTAQFDRSRVWLNLSQGPIFLNQILVGYIQNATTGVDESLDGKLLENGSTISSKIDSDNYIIQARPLPFENTDVVPLNFKALTAGTYTLSVDHTDGLFSGNQDIFIKDNLTGNVQNIKQNSYSFASTEGTFTNRFEIVYQSSPLGIENPSINANSVIVYKKDNLLSINSGIANMKSVKLFDISGRLIFEKSSINSNQTTINDIKTEQQVLLVQITFDGNRIITKKIVY